MIQAMQSVKENWTFTELDRTLLWRNTKMPERVDVWIVKCINHDGCAAIHRIMRKSGNIDWAGLTTMCFGSLAIQVRKVHAPTAAPNTTIIFNELRPGNWSHALLPIWPLGKDPVRWPGENGIDGYDGFQELADRLTRPVQGDKPEIS